MTEHPNLATAMLAARLELPAIPKTATNPHFKNKYVPLGELLKVVVPIYGSHGVLLTGEGAGGLDITATHVKTGEQKHVTVALIGAADMQRLGGCYTYAERYGYGALLALELEDDDDGNKAAGTTKAQGRAAAPAAKPAAKRTDPAFNGIENEPLPVNAPGDKLPDLDDLGRPAGHVYSECPSCHGKANDHAKETGEVVNTVRVNPQEGAEPHAYCWKRAGGCGATYTAKVWAAVGE